MDRMKEIEEKFNNLETPTPFEDDIEYLLAEIKRLKRKLESNEISWNYKGSSKSYHIELNGEEVHCTEDAYQRDMFIAELKARINIALREES